MTLLPGVITSAKTFPCRPPQNLEIKPGGESRRIQTHPEPRWGRKALSGFLCERIHTEVKSSPNSVL